MISKSNDVVVVVVVVRTLYVVLLYTIIGLCSYWHTGTNISKRYSTYFSLISRFGLRLDTSSISQQVLYRRLIKVMVETT